jgi:putative ABC transport system permease protein
MKCKKQKGKVMFFNWLKIAIRNITRYRIFSVVNVLGLAFGLAISIIIYVFIRQELSWDRYNKNHSRIYRVNSKVEAFDASFKSAMTPLLIGETMKKETPEVEEFTRVLMGSHKKVSYNDRQFSARNFYYSDQSFFRIFTVPVINGDPENLLTEENTVVITEQTAERYFGEEDPVGKMLFLDNGWKFRVTGVCENVPVNSHLHFDFLASLKGLMLGKGTDAWHINVVSTYVKLKEGTKTSRVQDDLEKIATENVYPELSRIFSEDIPSLLKNEVFGFYLQPLKDIHFATDVSDQFEAGRQKIYLYIFSVLAGIILLIACVNYMNLSTARLSTRIREVALRKVAGASRTQIIIQFLSESVFFSILSTFIALVIVELIARPFLRISGISINPENYHQWYLIPILITGTLIVGIISGSYPSLFLSRFSIIKIMKGGNYKGDRSTRLRGILVLTQFTLSIVMVISSLVMYDQVIYLQKKNLGFNKSNVVVIERAYALGRNEKMFREYLMKNPDILNTSLTLTLPGDISEKVPLYYEQNGKRKVAYLTETAADDDFVETMQMHLVQGTDFDPSLKSENAWQVLINESAVQELGLDNALDTRLFYNDPSMKSAEFKVTGVIKDYHFEPLYEKIRPLMITRIDSGMRVQNLAVRLNGEDIPGSIEYIQKVWRKLTDNEPFDYYFLDKDLDMQYKEEERTAGIFGIFSFLAIFIASLGLFGLAAHTAELRTREIGIRKAMGASVRRIAFMLVTYFTRWVMWSVLVAFPISYLAMKLWLGRFAYHVTIEVWFFITAAIIAIIVALFTVSFQSFKSATSSPVKALQYE